MNKSKMNNFYMSLEGTDLISTFTLSNINIDMSKIVSVELHLELHKLKPSVSWKNRYFQDPRCLPEVPIYPSQSTHSPSFYPHRLVLPVLFFCFLYSYA